MPQDDAAERRFLLDVTQPTEDVLDWESEQGEVEAPADAEPVGRANETLIEESRGASMTGVRNCKDNAAELANQALNEFVAEKTRMMGRPPIRSGHNGYTYHERTRPTRIGGARKCWLTVWVKCFAVFAS